VIHRATLCMTNMMTSRLTKWTSRLSRARRRRRAFASGASSRPPRWSSSFVHDVSRSLGCGAPGRVGGGVVRPAARRSMTSAMSAPRTSSSSRTVGGGLGCCRHTRGCLRTSASSRRVARVCGASIRAVHADVSGWRRSAPRPGRFALPEAWIKDNPKGFKPWFVSLTRNVERRRSAVTFR
jgi:hypothetical protein